MKRRQSIFQRAGVMHDKLILVVGVLAAGAFVACGAANYDPMVFPYSRQQVQTMLVDAKTALPTDNGPVHMGINIWATGRSEKGVALSMRSASWAPVINCEAAITAIDADHSRAVPDCSALDLTQDQLEAPMFEEHIKATLNKRAFDRETVSRKQTAIAESLISNIHADVPRMAELALRAAEADARMRRESRR